MKLLLFEDFQYTNAQIIKKALCNIPYLIIDELKDYNGISVFVSKNDFEDFDKIAKEYGCPLNVIIDSQLIQSKLNWKVDKCDYDENESNEFTHKDIHFIYIANLIHK